MSDRPKRYIPVTEEDGRKTILDMRIGTKCYSMEKAATWLNAEHELRLDAYERLISEHRIKPKTSRPHVDLHERRRRAA